MSEILPVELIPGTAVKVPAGSGFVPVFQEQLPMNVMPGETWSFNRVAAQFRAVLIEKEPERALQTLKTVNGYKNEAEAEEVMGQLHAISAEKQVSAGFSNPEESEKTKFEYERGGTFGDVIETTETASTQRSIFPCTAPAVVELINSDATLCSMSLDGTFRWISKSGEFFTGQCQFSGYLDLTNPVTIAVEKLQLRISIAIPLSVASELVLEASPATGSPGFVNLFYDKEVK